MLLGHLSSPLWTEGHKDNVGHRWPEFPVTETLKKFTIFIVVRFCRRCSYVGVGYGIRGLLGMLTLSLKVFL